MAAVPGQKLVHCNNKYKNTGHQGMPQRPTRDVQRHTLNLALIIKRCLPMVLTGSGMLCTTANAEEYYFNPIMLETTKSGMQTTNCSRFSKKYAQLQELIRLISG
ncbi:fimbrial usher protein [Escherichia coli]